MSTTAILIFQLVNSVVFLLLGAALTYRRQRGTDPMRLPDFNLRKAWSMITKRELTKEEEEIIDGTDKPESGRFDPTKLPSGSPR